MQKQPEILSGPDEESRAVVLPCEPHQFRDFIAGLLGRPQTIQRSVPGRFELEKSDIENLHHLVEQRMSSQNDATLVQFTARIVYDDNSSVLLNSFFDFVSYKEVKPLISRSLHVGWTYLVKFQNKQFPEKQQIDVSFLPGNSFQDVDFSFSSFPLRLSRHELFGGGFFYRISHTDRTWGTDIDGLLQGHLETLVKKDPPVRELIREKAGVIGLAASLTVAVSTIIASIYFATQALDAFYSDARNTVSSPATTIEQLGQQLQIFQKTILFDPAARYMLYVFGFDLAVVVGSIFLGATISNAALGEQRSFVLLTNKTQLACQRWRSRNDFAVIKICASIAGALFLSVLGNWLFYLLIKFWTPGA